MADPQNLTLDPGADTDYTLHDGSVWVTIGNVVAWIRKEGDRARIELFPLGWEGLPYGTAPRVVELRYADARAHGRAPQ